jgi:hypothetical protein
MRQVLLHIGRCRLRLGASRLPLLRLHHCTWHYFTWAFIRFAVAAALIAVVMLFDAQFQESADEPASDIFAKGAVWLVIAITAANALADFAECGSHVCADNPVSYQLLHWGGWSRSIRL